MYLEKLASMVETGVISQENIPYGCDKREVSAKMFLKRWERENNPREVAFQKVRTALWRIDTICKWYADLREGTGNLLYDISTSSEPFPDEEYKVKRDAELEAVRSEFTEEILTVALEVAQFRRDIRTASSIRLELEHLERR